MPMSATIMADMPKTMPNSVNACGSIDRVVFLTRISLIIFVSFSKRRIVCGNALPTSMSA